MKRRDFLKTGLSAAALPLAGRWPAHIAAPLAIDLTAALPNIRTGHLSLGTTRNPNGRSISADSRSLLRDGRPWSPVMGEFHFSRYPAQEWRDELLKMKAGGVDIAATYVFWLHHEEAENEWDWSGQRDLRRFVELCGEVGLYSTVRCGPWCHGEARNGGFPDWLLKKDFKLRNDNAGYLEKVRKLYSEIANQLKGLLWKNGGAVIGIQFENEFRGAAEHLLSLKRIAIEVGLDAPIYTRTGWPALNTKMPIGEIVPLFGVYAEGFWDRVTTQMPAKYGDGFLFKLARIDTSIATDQLGGQKPRDGDDVGSYPYFCCEIGGGMMSSYHRRILIAPKDIDSTSFVKIGSGNNLQGYYMYHGGTNPEGRLSTLQESQATNYWNDLPVKSYDFQAPLGEFGQIHKHYHSLRRLHLFLRDYGSLLATMPAYLPEKNPADSNDTTTLRWSVRTDGNSGFVFVNNYQRLQTMPQKESVQFELRLKDNKLLIPSKPFTVPSDSVFFFPFNLDLNGAKLNFATAQPICRVEDKSTDYFVFAQIEGVPTEFMFSGKITVEIATGKEENGLVSVRQLTPGTNTAIRLRTNDNKKISIVLLNEEQSLACWKGTLAGRERIFLTKAGLILDGDKLRLNAEDQKDLTVAIFPAPASLNINGAKLKPKQDGIFQQFTATKPRVTPVKVLLEKLQEAGAAREIKKGSKDVAEAPSDEDFTKAAVWRVKLPNDIDTNRNVFLRVRYAGDVARAYLDGKLLTDDFYNGNAFEIGLKRYAPDIYRKELLLKILPLRKDAPIYLAKEAAPNFGDAESALILKGVDVIENYEVQLNAK